jgi:hypothetical protein
MGFTIMNKKLSFVCLFSAIVFMMGMSPFFAIADQVNVKITNLKLDKSKIVTGDTLKLTYGLKVEGELHGCFNMGIRVRKGGKKKWVRTWGLPSKLCDDLNAGRVISQIWSVEMPDWGSGKYTISIHADMDNHVRSDNYRKDNFVEKNIVIIGRHPDIYISEFALNPSVPTQRRPVKVRVGVYNKGSAESGPFIVQWWAAQTFSKPACTWRVNKLAARGGRVFECNYKGYRSWYAAITTKVVADAGGDVKENDENNNERSMKIRVLRAEEKGVDLSPDMTPVKHQGDRNTCSVFGATALVEYLIYKDTGKKINLSEAYNYWLAKKRTLSNDHLRLYEHIDGLAGFLAVEAYRFSSMLETHWPYESRNRQQKGDPGCGAKEPPLECFTGTPPREAKPLSFKIKPKYIKRADIAKFILRERKPVIINILYNSKAVNNKTGEIRMLTGEEARIADGHVIALVGYDSLKKRFIFRNSYGPEWGNRGYGTIPEQYIIKHCEVCPKLSELNRMSPNRKEATIKASMGISGTLIK